MDVYGDKKEKGLRAQWKKMKGMSLQEKFDYFVHYYGLITLGILFALGVIIAITVAVVENNKPKLLTGDFYTDNITDEGVEYAKNHLCEILGLDPDDTNVGLYSSYVQPDDSEALIYQEQGLQAHIYAMDVDFIGATEDRVSGYMNPADIMDCPFLDLREILSEELIKELDSQGRLIYLNTTFAGQMPYLVECSNSRFFGDMGFTSDSCCIGFLAKTENFDGIRALCEYIAEIPE